MNVTDVSVGKSITSINDPLTRMPLEQVFNFVVHPSPSHAASIERLRSLCQIAPDQYRNAKKTLPYVVGATFYPSVRKAMNFAATSVFIVDVDHLSEKEVDVEVLKRRLMMDDRVLMFFVSPGGDGLKVFFRFSEKCDDKELYSLFYKRFVVDFGKKYDLQQLVDARTSDVARACFLSVDPEAYYNGDARGIQLKDYLPVESESEMSELIFEQAREQSQAEPPASSSSLSKDPAIIDAIRQKLNPSALPIKRAEVYTPEPLKEIIPHLTEEFAQHSLKLDVVKSIQYGKQLRIVAEQGIWAELNLFYGKHGYSVVKTTKTGSHSELAALVARLLKEILINFGCYVR